MDGAHPFTAIVTVKLRGSLDEARLRGALRGVQAKHPMLRSLIVHEQARPWFVLQPAPPPIPLRVLPRTGDEDWLAAAREEWGRLFDAAREPLARMVWLRGESASELILVCHHCICDGVSVANLLREILLLCDQPEADIGEASMFDDVRTLLLDKVPGARRLQRRVRWPAALFRLIVRLKPVRPPQDWGRFDILRWKLDEELSRALSRRCKAEGVTAFAALSVALMLAFQHGCGADGVGKFKVPVDVRLLLRKLIKADMLFAAAPTVDLAWADQQDRDFWSRARLLKSEANAKVSRLGGRLQERLLGMELLHPVFARMLAQSRGEPVDRNVLFTYLGKLKIPQRYAHFEVEAVHGPVGQLTTAESVVAISVFAERYDITIASHEAALPPARALAVKQHFIDILRACTEGVPMRSRQTAGAPAPLTAEAT